MSARRSSSRDISRAVKPRKDDSHKGENGVVLVVGGSWLYHGAPALASLSALRTGVDVVYVAVPRQLATAVRAVSPNLIVYPLPDAKVTRGCVDRLLKWLPKIDGAVIGPGMGAQPLKGLIRLVGEIAARDIKMVLDADALRSEVVAAVKGRPVVITPHAGEFKRMFGVELAQSLKQRRNEVKHAAAKSQVVILLKGRVDVISDGKKLVENHTGSPAMTVGGTGDSLSGVVAGLMARGAEPMEAAIAGARVNGLAGMKAVGKLGMHLTATDVIEEIPQVLKKFDKILR